MGRSIVISQWTTVFSLGLALGGLLMHLSSCTSFDKRLIHNHVKMLASDDFDGRAPMTAGELKAVSYLEENFRTYGLKPLPKFQGFRQSVPLARIHTDVTAPILFSNMILKPSEDIVVTSNALQDSIKIKDVPVVFVGFGINAPEYSWNDYQNINVKGKIVVMLVNDPGFSSPNLFRGKDMTYYGRWTYKFEEAARQGALGAFVIHETDAAGYGFHVVSHKSSTLKINNTSDGLLLQGWLSLDATNNIFQSMHLNFGALKQQAINKANTHADLGILSLQAKNAIALGKSYNVCGYLEGHDTNHYTAISAHWDHLGSTDNTQGKKDIYRGAIDNGTGVAAILELARYFSKNKPQNNLLVCSFTAEEQGLLGAQYFVDHPPVPLSSLKGMLNFDCLNVDSPNKNIVFYGPKTNSLYPVLVSVAKEADRGILDDPNASKGYFYRSDHFPFIQNQVPSLLFMDIGISNPKYLTHHYHQPTDAHDPSWTLDGFMQDLELFKQLINRL